MRWCQNPRRRIAVDDDRTLRLALVAAHHHQWTFCQQIRDRLRR